MFARGILSQLSNRVGRDGLFEQPGERPPSQPLPAAEPQPPAVTAEPAGTPTAPATPSPRKGARKGARTGPRPADGCVPVDKVGLQAALQPGERPLIVNHWATWCDPCVDELPRLVRAAAGLGDSAEFIGVSWDLFDHPGTVAKIASRVASFAASSGVGFGSVLFTGAPADLFELCKLDVELVPQTLVLAPDGTVRWHKKGMLTDDDVFPLIAAARAARSTG